MSILDAVPPKRQYTQIDTDELEALKAENVALREWKSRSLHINIIGMILSCYGPLSEHVFQEIMSTLRSALPPKPEGEPDAE